MDLSTYSSEEAFDAEDPTARNFSSPLAIYEFTSIKTNVHLPSRSRQPTSPCFDPSQRATGVLCATCLSRAPAEQSSL